MYNFRYHLVTIVSIFAALAIGLLLGVAITGSDLLRNTSDDLVASLQNQYTVLRQDNSSISESLKFEQGTSSFFFDDWRKERMNGRVIVLLSENNKTELDTQDSLASLVMSSGGAVVKVKVLVPNFGLDDPDTFAALKLLVTGLGNDNASQQLASALLTEWSYSGKVQTLPVSSNNPTDTSADPGAQADVQAGGNAGLINANNLPDQYPLTSYLVKQKIIALRSITLLSRHCRKNFWIKDN
ncbi:MAG: copper transporter [Coriobacteriales bacterium]|jgi:hypothetical protein|nr:copper transporter [Coriobacteriales bacterium]